MLNGYGNARDKMVDGQVLPNEVSDRRVLAAMRELPREAYAPNPALAYSDADLKLGGGRTMLAPMKQAKLAQLVLADNPKHVLVIGSGTGYAAALLAACGVQVVALEEAATLVSPALAATAPGVERATGRLEAGWPAGGPYDAILIEGGVARIPDRLAAQLVPGGRIVAVLVEQLGGGAFGVGRAVLAEPVAGGGFATLPVFDCAAPILPGYAPAPEFSFQV